MEEKEEEEVDVEEEEAALATHLSLLEASQEVRGLMLTMVHSGVDLRGNPQLYARCIF